MTEREKLVLNAVIDYYLTFGETIGSRALVKKYEIDLSSATIRNVMADLEDMGYISKTHISSGRIPTDKGYRLYLDKLLEIEKITKQEKFNIKNIYEQRVSELDLMLKKTSSLLSKLTNYAGIAIEPNQSKEKVKKIELVHLDDFLVMAVIVMENKSIRTKKIILDKKMSREEVFKLSEEINNEKFSQEELKEFLFKTKGEEFKEITEAISNEISQDVTGQLFMDNAQGIVNTDTVGALEILKLFNDNKNVKILFEEMINKEEKNYGAVNVIFGDELQIKGLENYSFVYSLYKMGDSEGVIGVIGPKRMAYSKTIALVEFVTNEVKEVIKKIEEKIE